MNNKIRILIKVFLILVILLVLFWLFSPVAAKNALMYLAGAMGM